MKVAQDHGSYDFSPSASVTISECVKTLLSILFFWQECKGRVATGIPPSTRGTIAEEDSVEDGSLSISDEEGAIENREATSNVTRIAAIGEHARLVAVLDARAFWSYIRGEVTSNGVYGQCNLAMFYAMINSFVGKPSRSGPLTRRPFNANTHV